MKKIFYSLLCIIGLSACSTENAILDSLRVYDIANSTCKLSLSPTETRPDFYAENNAMPAILGIELDKDGIAQCMLEDVKANCAVKNIYVNIANQDNQIILVVYHNILDALADCICKYDVRFKMSKLPPGNYKLKVYYARPNMKYDESNIAYNGQVNIVQNRKVSVKFNLEPGLPEN
ncbi:hypothetical protein [Segatella oris]|uniref:Lipoprotein n=1 Tax=Segatella oris TaxID=28135 RepID=A0A448L4X6_9BACT|nr:hypothetical protein [Segatella oris]VEH15045.1 Uncharacterised protein [Segatella oris]